MFMCTGFLDKLYGECIQPIEAFSQLIKYFQRNKTFFQSLEMPCFSGKFVRYAGIVTTLYCEQCVYPKDEMKPILTLIL